MPRKAKTRRRSGIKKSKSRSVKRSMSRRASRKMGRRAGKRSRRASRKRSMRGGASKNALLRRLTAIEGIIETSNQEGEIANAKKQYSMIIKQLEDDHGHTYTARTFDDPPKAPEEKDYYWDGVMPWEQHQERKQAAMMQEEASTGSMKNRIINALTQESIQREPNPPPYKTVKGTFNKYFDYDPDLLDVLETNVVTNGNNSVNIIETLKNSSVTFEEIEDEVIKYLRGL